MAYETAVLKQLEAYTAKHISRMGGFSPHIRLTDYPSRHLENIFFGWQTAKATKPLTFPPIHTIHLHLTNTKWEFSSTSPLMRHFDCKESRMDELFCKYRRW